MQQLAVLGRAEAIVKSAKLFQDRLVKEVSPCTKSQDGGSRKSESSMGLRGASRSAALAVEIARVKR